jgi:uncharacterized protein
VVTRVRCDDFELEAEATLQSGGRGAVVCHPHPAFGGRLDTPLVVALDRALAERGLSTLRFNFRGLGGSGGTPTGGLTEHADVHAAAAWLRQHGVEQLALVGYSFGALMAMRAVAEGEAACAFAAVGFPTTIIGDNADRLTDVARALATGMPWLFLQGDADSFCELDRVKSWAQPPHVELQVLAGQGHFFDGAAAQEVVRRVAEFVARSVR